MQGTNTLISLLCEPSDRHVRAFLVVIMASNIFGRGRLLVIEKVWWTVNQGIPDRMSLKPICLDEGYYVESDCCGIYRLSFMLSSLQSLWDDITRVMQRRRLSHFGLGLFRLAGTGGCHAP